MTSNNLSGGVVLRTPHPYFFRKENDMNILNGMSGIYNIPSLIQMFFTCYFYHPHHLVGECLQQGLGL